MMVRIRLSFSFCIHGSSSKSKIDQVNWTSPIRFISYFIKFHSNYKLQNSQNIIQWWVNFLVHYISHMFVQFKYIWVQPKINNFNASWFTIIYSPKIAKTIELKKANTNYKHGFVNNIYFLTGIVILHGINILYCSMYMNKQGF